MIQTDTFKAAGISEQDIRQLTAAWDAFQTAKNQVRHQTPHIVCTGIYNAGKSTLLNALAGKEIFPTGDIPTTKKMAQAEFGGAVYIDTPGLNAMEEDDRETQAAYEAADFILFVANAQDGGISAAEALWLQKLKERYGSLQQRLIFVLTHSAQVDPEQLPMIQEKVCGDISKAVDFTPNQILCVDSITFQDGAADNELLLMEASGIPQLQAYLSGCVTDAAKTLQDAYKADITERKRELSKQITHCRNYCLDQITKVSGQSHREDVDALFAEAKENIAAICKRTADIGSTYVYVPYGQTRIKRMGVTSPFSVEAAAKEALNQYYKECMSEARRKLSDCVDTIEKKYGTTGMNSFYFEACSSVNGILEKILLELRKLDIAVEKTSEISMEPDYDDLANMVRDVRERRTEVEFYDGTGLFNTCYDVFGRKFETEDIREEHYKKTLFGGKWVEDVGTEINMFSAMCGASEQVQEQTSRFAESATKYVNDVLRSFLKKLKTEADNRLKEIRRHAEASMARTAEIAEKPYQTALAHLDMLKKEVTP